MGFSFPGSDERLGHWLKFVSAIICAIIVAYAGNSISNDIQQQRLELQKMAEFGRYVEYALSSNVATRRNLARYFIAVTEDEKLREKWMSFLELVNKEYKDIEDAKEKQQQRLKNLDLSEEEKERLRRGIIEMQQELKVVPRSGAAGYGVSPFGVTPFGGGNFGGAGKSGDF
ncbi:MAG: hypothetical protein KAJ18_03270 [Candidatus Omnitrophica bacterium]|nr:hypothetical protein [Candidatus Omnitrophota bacterium]